MKTKDNVWFNGELATNGCTSLKDQIGGYHRDKCVQWHNDAVDLGMFTVIKIVHMDAIPAIGDYAACPAEYVFEVIASSDYEDWYDHGEVVYRFAVLDKEVCEHEA